MLVTTISKSSLADTYGITIQTLRNWVLNACQHGKVDFEFSDYRDCRLIKPRIYTSIKKAFG